MKLPVTACCTVLLLIVGCGEGNQFTAWEGEACELTQIPTLANGSGNVPTAWSSCRAVYDTSSSGGSDMLEIKLKGTDPSGSGWLRISINGQEAERKTLNVVDESRLTTKFQRPPAGSATISYFNQPNDVVPFDSGRLVVNSYQVNAQGSYDPHSSLLLDIGFGEVNSPDPHRMALSGQLVVSAKAVPRPDSEDRYSCFDDQFSCPYPK